MFSHEHEVEMTRRYRKDHDLMGMEADDILSIFDIVKEKIYGNIDIPMIMIYIVLGLEVYI